MLETDRVVIRPFGVGDFDEIDRILAACFEPRPVDERRSWFDWSTRNLDALAGLHQPPYGDRAIVERASGVLVGSVGLVPSFGPFGRIPGIPGDPERFQPQMGLFWCIAPERQGNGLATDAARAMVRLAFEECNVERLVATTEHTNGASIAVMRHLGMRVERNPAEEPPWFQVVGVLDSPVGETGIGTS